jgi:hypothetical protein
MYCEIEAGSELDPQQALTQCVESSADAVLFDVGALPNAFFDLSSGLAGELLHKFGTYGIRLAGVVPDPSIHPERFQQFMSESNRGTQYRFFETREEAIAWLSQD